MRSTAAPRRRRAVFISLLVRHPCTAKQALAKLPWLGKQGILVFQLPCEIQPMMSLFPWSCARRFLTSTGHQAISVHHVEFASSSLMLAGNPSLIIPLWYVCGSMTRWQWESLFTNTTNLQRRAPLLPSADVRKILCLTGIWKKVSRWCVWCFTRPPVLFPTQTNSITLSNS